MTDARAVPIGDQRVTTDDTTAVNSPYDGRELARYPRMSRLRDRDDGLAILAQQHGASSLT